MVLSSLQQIARREKAKSIFGNEVLQATLICDKFAAVTVNLAKGEETDGKEPPKKLKDMHPLLCL